MNRRWLTIYWQRFQSYKSIWRIRWEERVIHCKQSSSGGNKGTLNDNDVICNTLLDIPRHEASLNPKLNVEIYSVRTNMFKEEGRDLMCYKVNQSLFVMILCFWHWLFKYTFSLVFACWTFVFRIFIVCVVFLVVFISLFVNLCVLFIQFFYSYLSLFGAIFHCNSLCHGTFCIARLSSLIFCLLTDPFLMLQINICCLSF